MYAVQRGTTNVLALPVEIRFDGRAYFERGVAYQGWTFAMTHLVQMRRYYPQIIASETQPRDLNAFTVPVRNWEGFKGYAIYKTGCIGLRVLAGEQGDDGMLRLAMKDMDYSAMHPNIIAFAQYIPKYTKVKP